MVNKQEATEMLKKENVKFVKLCFTDILGFFKTFTVPIHEFLEGMEEGFGFDGSSIEGFTRIDESDMICIPDLNTLKILPWQVGGLKSALCFVDIYNPDKTPFDGDPRFCLKRNLGEAKRLGFTYYTGPEVEYFYFKNAHNAETIDDAGYFDLISADESLKLRQETVDALEYLGIHVEKAHHEVAPSQHEIDFRYADALTTADTVILYKYIVKEIARKNNCYATFMPKPLFGQNGSGMHTHMSLFKDSKNAFYDKNGQYFLSKIALQFIAGLLKYAPEFTLVCNQWVNSYKRLVSGYEAPVYITWAQKNRSDLIRVPLYHPGKEVSTRIEYRATDPSCNPYLAFAVLLQAGLEGIRKDLTPPPPVEVNVYKLTDQQRKDMKIETLPGSLLEAIQNAEKSEIVKKALGEHIFHNFIENKKIEWERYRIQVTDYELKTYLPLL